MISVLIVRQDNCHLHSTTMAYNAHQICWNSSSLFSPSFLSPSMLSIIWHLALNKKGIPHGCQTIIPELLLRAPPESAPCNAFTSLQEKKTIPRAHVGYHIITVHELKTEDLWALSRLGYLIRGHCRPALTSKSTSLWDLILINRVSNNSAVL